MLELDLTKTFPAFSGRMRLDVILENARWLLEERSHIKLSPQLMALVHECTAGEERLARPPPAPPPPRAPVAPRTAAIVLADAQGYRKHNEDSMVAVPTWLKAEMGIQRPGVVQVGTYAVLDAVDGLLAALAKPVQPQEDEAVPVAVVSIGSTSLRVFRPVALKKGAP